MVMNLVTPKAGANRKLLFNKPASEVGLLNIQVGLKCTTKFDQNHIFNNYKFGNT
jgi:hypothetical protein